MYRLSFSLQISYNYLCWRIQMFPWHCLQSWDATCKEAFCTHNMFKAMFKMQAVLSSYTAHYFFVIMHIYYVSCRSNLRKPVNVLRGFSHIISCLWYRFWKKLWIINMAYFQWGVLSIRNTEYNMYPNDMIQIYLHVNRLYYTLTPHICQFWALNLQVILY